MITLEDIDIMKSVRRYVNNSENRRLHRVGQEYGKTGIKEDKAGNLIGDGKYHSSYDIIDFPGRPYIRHSVDKSQSTESVYVTYTNKNNGKFVRLRFSNHESNSVKFGDDLNGKLASRDEILYRLGEKKRTFVPHKRLTIETRQVSKKDLVSGKFEEADKTIKELYSLGAGADLSKYKGKIAKDSNYLIVGDKVHEYEDFKLDSFGRKVSVGDFVYEDLSHDNDSKS